MKGQGKFRSRRRALRNQQFYSISWRLRTIDSCFFILNNSAIIRLYQPGTTEKIVRCCAAKQLICIKIFSYRIGGHPGAARYNYWV